MAKEHELHVRVDGDLMVAVNEMANDHHEGNASQAVRQALREKATELGYLPEKAKASGGRR